MLELRDRLFWCHVSFRQKAEVHMDMVVGNNGETFYSLMYIFLGIRLVTVAQ